MIMCLGHPPTSDSNSFLISVGCNVSQGYTRASYDIVLVHFLLQFIHLLLQRFSPVQAFVRHLDDQLAPNVARGKDVSGPFLLTLYIFNSLMLNQKLVPKVQVGGASDVHCDPHYALWC